MIQIQNVYVIYSKEFQLDCKTSKVYLYFRSVLYYSRGHLQTGGQGLLYYYKKERDNEIQGACESEGIVNRSANTIR